MLYGKIRHITLLTMFSLLSLGPGRSYAQQTGNTLTMFETDDFSGSGNCASCHSNLQDQGGNDVSIDSHWRSTMMANAAKDPLWQAKLSLEVELQDNQEIKQVIQEKCSRCHMGMARYQQLTDGGAETDIYVLDTGFLDPGHALHEAAMDGVSCTLCHQVQPDNLGLPESFTGKYKIETTTDPPFRTLFGPYFRPLLNPMQQAAGYVPTYHEPDFQMEDPAHCGTCHTLYTPALDADGGYLWEFPEQMTYLEWEHSQVTQTCQDCHLPDAAGSVVISNRPRRLQARTPFRQHHYVGGNSFMVNLLKNNAGPLGITASGRQLDATIDRTLGQLGQHTAELTATASSADMGNRLIVTVDVKNLAGHKFPSGLPSRRAWLHVKVADANGAVVFESGRPLGDGSIEGNDADTNPAEFEPHHDTISAAEQVQIYEPVMRNFEGEVTHTLLRACEYAKDNRLLPYGFDKSTAHDDYAVYGEARGDTNFTGGSDRVVYDVVVSGWTGDLAVTVELLFQSVSYSFVRDLENTPRPTDLVQNFLKLYDGENNAPVVIARTELTVP